MKTGQWKCRSYRRLISKSVTDFIMWELIKLKRGVGHTVRTKRGVGTCFNVRTHCTCQRGQWLNQNCSLHSTPATTYFTVKTRCSHFHLHVWNAPQESSVIRRDHKMLWSLGSSWRGIYSKTSSCTGEVKMSVESSEFPCCGDVMWSENISRWKCYFKFQFYLYPTSCATSQYIFCALRSSSTYNFLYFLMTLR